MVVPEIYAMQEIDYTSYQEGTPQDALHDKPLVAYVQNRANGGVRLELVKFNGREKQFELFYPRTENNWNMTEIGNWGQVIKWLPVRELGRDELPKPEPDPALW
ncbi:hypothetical protein [Hymenobacter sp. IS2118]|uniref:hypothetical protein n=1 Tax=Hymenobacter sp. IS2118 TaxID=1505605 RepID=UPI00054FCFB0|nr:hypothetical protein [Hymenobacter sp. IS2118]